MHLTSSRLAAAAWLVAALGLARPATALEAAGAIDFSAPLPEVAAEYRSTLREGTADARTSTWRFWRERDSVERENPERATGELWQRDGAAVFLTRIYHADRKGIEYRNDDLEMLDSTPQWRQLSLLLDPGVLEALAPVGHDGDPVRRYVGEVDGTKWDVAFRTDLMLPVSVLRTRGDRTEQLELLQATPRDRAPWQPTPIAGYEIIDHADLGDRERDPFVMRIAAEEGYGHDHGRAGGHAH